MLQISPVFVDYTYLTDVMVVNGREFNSFQKAANVFRKERDMQAYMQMCLAAQEQNERNDVPFQMPALELGGWELAATAQVGPEVMIRLRATEQQRYTFNEESAVKEAGFVTGWFLLTPQNLKGIKDRTLFIDEQSSLFGDAAGKVTITKSSVIGYIRDSQVKESVCAFSVLNDVKMWKSNVSWTTLTKVKVLHSEVCSTVANRALLSSCNVNQFTVINSQLTDVRGYFAGLKDCTVSSKTFNSCKISNLCTAGDNEVIENKVDSVALDYLTRLLAHADHQSELTHLHKQLKDRFPKNTLDESMDSAVAETGEALRWKVDKSQGQAGRTVLEVSGDPQSIQSPNTTGTLMNETPTSVSIPELKGDDEDAELAELVKDRQGGPTVSVNLDDLDDDLDEDIEDDEYLGRSKETQNEQ